MFELLLLAALVVFALFFTKLGLMVLAVGLIALGAVALLKLFGFVFQLILIPFQIVGGLLVGMLAIPFALLLVPVAILAVITLLGLVFFGGLAALGAFFCAF